MSQKYNNIPGALPKRVGITEDLFKALQDQDLIFEVDLKKALTELEARYYNPFDRVNSARRITSEIKKAVIIGAGTFGPAERIAYFIEKRDNILEKAYGGLEGAEGETRVWGGKTYKKVGKKWQFVGKDSPIAKLVDQAAELGTKAFKEGKSSIPAHDVELMKIIGDLKGEVGSSLPILSAWAKAWHKENMKKIPTSSGNEKVGLDKKNVKIDVDSESIGYTIKNVGPGGVETVEKHEPGKRTEDFGSKILTGKKVQVKTFSGSWVNGTVHHHLEHNKDRVEVHFDGGGDGVYNISELKETPQEFHTIKDTSPFIQAVTGSGQKVDILDSAGEPVFDLTALPKSATVNIRFADGHIETRYAEQLSPYTPMNKKGLYDKPAYYKDMSGENVFELGGKRWQYVWTDYDGRIDIGVYSPDEDITYGYDWFRENFIDKPQLKEVKDEFSVRDILGGDLSGDYKKDLERAKKSNKFFTQSLYDEAYQNTMQP